MVRTINVSIAAFGPVCNRIQVQTAVILHVLASGLAHHVAEDALIVHATREVVGAQSSLGRHIARYSKSLLL